MPTQQACSCKREHCGRRGNCRRRLQIAVLHFTAHRALSTWENALPESVRTVVMREKEPRRDGDLWGVPWSKPVEVTEADRILADRERRRIGTWHEATAAGS